MKITLFAIGPTFENYLQSGIEDYLPRIKRLANFEMEILANVKNSSKLEPSLLKEKEAEMVFSKLKEEDHLVLLDEKGSQFRSVAWADHLQKLFNQSPKRVVFLIGGAYGFSGTLYERANEKLSLSPMTFSHQLVRLIFLEQLFRGLGILANFPYHHE